MRGLAEVEGANREWGRVGSTLSFASRTSNMSMIATDERLNGGWLTCCWVSSIQQVSAAGEARSAHPATTHSAIAVTQGSKSGDKLGAGYRKF